MRRTGVIRTKTLIKKISEQKVSTACATEIANGKYSLLVTDSDGRKYSLTSYRGGGSREFATLDAVWSYVKSIGIEHLYIKKDEQNDSYQENNEELLK